MWMIEARYGVLHLVQNDWAVDALLNDSDGAEKSLYTARLSVVEYSFLFLLCMS